MSSNKNKKHLLPKRRFPEFKAEWETKKLSHLELNVTAGATPDTSNSKYWDGDIRWMNSGELNLKKVYEVENRITEQGLKETSTKMLPKFCVLIGLAGQGKTRGTVAMNMVELCTNQSIAAIHPSKNIDSYFLYHELDGRYEELRRISAGDGGRGGLNLQHIKDLDIVFPKTQKEQQKIADCLSSLDEVITLQKKKVGALKDYKKSLMQRLFPREGQFTPELRFSGFKGKWVNRKLNELLFETKRRNRDLKYNANDVLSVSGEYGCVNQIEFMGRSYAGKSVKDYHVVETGDIVYTKSPLKKNPYGIIKENKGRVGIVSTLYAVYRTTELGCPAYLEQYFSVDHNLNSYLQPLVKKGAKNDMKVNNEYVLSGDIIVPETRKEQERITEYLSSVDSLLQSYREKFQLLQRHKKGLLQQLFPSLRAEVEE